MANGHFFFNPHPPPQNGHFEVGKFSNVLKAQFLDDIGQALCQYVTGAGFPPRPSQLFFNNERADRNIKNELTWNTCCLTVRKEAMSEHTFHWVKLQITSLYLLFFDLEKEHQTELQTDGQHQFKTKKHEIPS